MDFNHNEDMLAAIHPLDDLIAEMQPKLWEAHHKHPVGSLTRTRSFTRLPRKLPDNGQTNKRVRVPVGLKFLPRDMSHYDKSQSLIAVPTWLRDETPVYGLWIECTRFKLPGDPQAFSRPITTERIPLQWSPVPMLAVTYGYIVARSLWGD